MADLNEMLVFAAVVEVGSFTGAAKKLGQPKSTLSRRISRLEERLGVRLLQRTTRALHLTDAGETYYHYCQRVAAEAAEAEEAINNARVEPSGPLKITAPVNFAGVLPRLVSAFMERYPKITVQIVCSDNLVDIIGEGIDAAFRFGELQDSTFVARRLGADPGITCASPGYLEKAPPLEKPEELVNHHCIAYNPPQQGSHWTFDGPGGRRTVKVYPRLSVNNLDIIRDAAIAGMGVCRLPSRLCVDQLEAGTLKSLLPEWSFTPINLNLVYPSSRLLPTKTRAFIDFAVGLFRDYGMAYLTENRPRPS